MYVCMYCGQRRKLVHLILGDMPCIMSLLITAIEIAQISNASPGFPQSSEQRQIGLI